MRLTIKLMSIIGLMSISTNVWACTGFVAGKDITADGSIMIGRTEDIGSAYNKNYIVVPAVGYQENVYFEDLNGFKYPMPTSTYKYTMLPDVEEHGDGVYASAGINEMGVAMTATVSAAINDDVKMYDPLVKEGLREAAIPSVILPQAKTAKEGVELLGAIVEEYGSKEGNIILFADQNEAWYMEILSGHQWVAVKVPDDKYAVIPNAFMLGYVDLEDTENVLSSPDVINLPKQNGFLKEYEGQFHLALTYGDELQHYNRSRAWGGQHFFSPSQEIAYDVEVFDLFMTPDDKIELQEVMDLQRYRYEGTDIDANKNKEVRAIGTERQAECHIIQMREDYPKGIDGLMWLAMGNAEHSVYLPTYGIIQDTHEAYKVPGTEYNQDAAYWSFRGLSALAEIDRENYGAGVRDFWKEYEHQLIQIQKETDEHFIELYNQNPQEAKETATDLGILIAGDAINQANDMYAQLMTLISKQAGSTPSKQFVPDNYND
ncbi:dipeptidase [Candidatus Epulonipiscium fishelsonii]|nr:dipeptidase [Epulopiscium sp. SCG-C06WGA-EpuloA1]